MSKTKLMFCGIPIDAKEVTLCTTRQRLSGWLTLCYYKRQCEESFNLWLAAMIDGEERTIAHVDTAKDMATGLERLTLSADHAMQLLSDLLARKLARQATKKQPAKRTAKKRGRK